MSSTDGDTASRLDDAVADVLAGAPTLPDRAPRAGAVPPATTDDDWGVDDPADAYELPEIVPATPSVPAASPTSHTSPASVPPGVVPPSTPAAARPSPAAPATGWSDHMSTVPAGAHGGALRAPGRKPRVRRVTRVLRHIDPWSTFKVALLFSFVAYLVALTSGVLLWRVADATGTLANVERWFTQFGWETFELDGGEIFRNAWIIGLFGAVALTGALVLLATLFNLVSDIVGGVRMTVLEEEVVERTVSSTRRYVVRRAPVSDANTGGTDWDVGDDDGDDTPASSTAAATNDGPSTADWTVDDDDDPDDDVAPVDRAAARSQPG